MDSEGAEKKKFIKNIKLFFDQMEENFKKQKGKALGQQIKILYKDEGPHLEVDKWRHKINFHQYESSQLGQYLSKILHDVQEFKRLKQSKGKIEAFKYQLTILIHVLKIFEELKDKTTFWICGALRMAVRATKPIFIESSKTSHGANLKIDDLINILQRYKTSRSLIDDVKKEILPLIDNMQISILLVFHNYDQISRILKAPKTYEQGENFINNFLFQKGKVALINQRMKEAEENLQKIKIDTVGQKRIVLKYLIPCKMFLGKMFIKKSEDQWFPEYESLINTIMNANFKEFEDVLQGYSKIWIKRGIYLLMDKLRIIIWRNLIKMVYQAQNNNKISIDIIEKGARIKGATEKLSECICIISNLIYEGFVKGYIFQSQSHHVLVLRQKNPFPPLSAIY